MTASTTGNPRPARTRGPGIRAAAACHQVIRSFPYAEVAEDNVEHVLHGDHSKHFFERGLRRTKMGRRNLRGESLLERFPEEVDLGARGLEIEVEGHADAKDALGIGELVDQRHRSRNGVDLRSEEDDVTPTLAQNRRKDAPRVRGLVGGSERRADATEIRQWIALGPAETRPEFALDCGLCYRSR